LIIAVAEKPARFPPHHSCVDKTGIFSSEGYGFGDAFDRQIANHFILIRS